LKVPGSKRAAQVLAQHRHGDPRALSAGIHFSRRGREHQVGAGAGQELDITLQVARVALEVFVRSELGRVDEDADGHALGVTARHLHQPQMPGMERAHRRYEAKSYARPAHLLAGRPKLRDGAMNRQLHAPLAGP
jgi:hypothetical protein